MAAEGGEVLQENAWLVGDDLPPAGLVAALAQRHFQDPEVLRVPVAQDHGHLVDDIQVILMARLALQHDRRRPVRTVSGQVPALGGQGGDGRDEDPGIILRLVQHDEETVVRFPIHQRIPVRVGAQPVAKDPIRNERVGLLFDIKQRAAVIGPDHVAGGIGDALGQECPIVEIPDPQGPFPAGDRILGEGQVAAVRTDGDARHVEKAVPRCEIVDVQHDFLDRVGVVPATHVDRMLQLAPLPGPVPVVALQIGHAVVILFDATAQFLEQHLLGIVARRQMMGCVFRLGPQIGQHLGVLPLVIAQPVIVVNPFHAVLNEALGATGGLGRLHGVTVSG